MARDRGTNSLLVPVIPDPDHFVIDYGSLLTKQP